MWYMIYSKCCLAWSINDMPFRKLSDGLIDIRTDSQECGSIQSKGCPWHSLHERSPGRQLLCKLTYSRASSCELQFLFMFVTPASGLQNRQLWQYQIKNRNRHSLNAALLFAALLLRPSPLPRDKNQPFVSQNDSWLLRCTFAQGQNRCNMYDVCTANSY